MASRPQTSRVGLAASAALHLTLVMGAWQLTAHLREPPPVPASFEVVFPPTPTAAPAPTLPAPARPAPASTLPTAPPPLGNVALPRRVEVQRSQAPQSRPHAAAPRRVSVAVEPVTPARPAAPMAPAPISPAQAVEAPRPAPDLSVVATLEQRIDQAVNAAKSYPPTARRLGLQGRSQVSFSYRDGVVTEIALTRSSSADMLDRAALEAVRRAAYPAAPPSLAHRPLQLAVWLDFSMRQANW